MKYKKGELTAAVGAIAVLTFSFAVMPSVLATTAKPSDIQTVTGNPLVLQKSGTAAQTINVNAISEDQAIQNAADALDTLGFDTQDFREQPTETRYIAQTVPAGDPVWAIIFRDDQDGYAYVLGSDVNYETREKLAALGEVEACTDENGTSGIRAHYSYTRYTLVEINALNGAYVRHGTAIVALGQPLNIDETYWAPTTEEAWERERQRLKELEKK